MIKLLRFINPQGNGLYQDDFWQTIGLPYYNEDIPYHQPIVYEDVKGWCWKTCKNYLCAFENPKQLVSWFRDANPLNVFIEGGKLIEITVAPESLWRGRHQCMYPIANIIAIREVDSDEFIELISPAMKELESVVIW